MTVTCPNCKAALTIPDDRLPRGKVVTAACPRCKGPIAIDLTGGAPPPPGPSAASAPAPVDAALEEDSATYEERGNPRALVCMPVPAERQQAMAALKQAGYAPRAAKNADEAIERLRFSVHALVIFREDFDGVDPAAPSLRAFLTDMGTGNRRNIHVVLVSDSITSHDARTAFARSVDLVLHPTDLPHLVDALRHSKAEAEIRYRVLKESLQALGKA
jgi:CheY-like chemotaxis protein